jgi:hypothetical protein
MIDFFRAGGFSMWIVLALGLAALVLAFGLLRDPEPRRLGVVRALSRAETFAIAGGVASNLMAVFWHIAHDDAALRDPAPALFQGLGEAIAPAVLGFTMLSVAWLVVGVAVRRAAVE